MKSQSTKSGFDINIFDKDIKVHDIKLSNNMDIMIKSVFIYLFSDFITNEEIESIAEHKIIYSFEENNMIYSEWECFLKNLYFWDEETKVNENLNNIKTMVSNEDKDVYFLIDLLHYLFIINQNKRILLECNQDNTAEYERYYKNSICDFKNSASLLNI